MEFIDAFYFLLRSIHTLIATAPYSHHFFFLSNEINILHVLPSRIVEHRLPLINYSLTKQLFTRLAHFKYISFATSLNYYCTYVYCHFIALCTVCSAYLYTININTKQFVVCYVLCELFLRYISYTFLSFYLHHFFFKFQQLGKCV